LVSTSIIGGGLQKVLDVFVFEELLDPSRAEVHSGQHAIAAICDELHWLAVRYLQRGREQTPQRVLHDGVEAPMVTRRERLGFGEKLFVEPERGARHTDILAA
jgi:hypothetical protein